MSDSPIKLPLFVDLDGTLIKSDVTRESLLLLIKNNPFMLLLMPLWLCKGRAYLKYQLAQRIKLPVEMQPLNPGFLQYLQQQRTAGRAVTLISASNQLPVRQIGAHVGLFDACIGSDAKINLKSSAKLQRILELTGDRGFAYAGNSRADLPVWEKANEVIMVNCTPQLERKLNHSSGAVLRFDAPASHWKLFGTAIRPHQWLKNGLVLLPLILSHQLNQIDLLVQASFAFISFSLCASSVYLLNDMLDLNSDRQHPSKRLRPFAAGELPLYFGLLGAPLLLLVSFLIATLLPDQFLFVLVLYWILTAFYSLYLKRLFLIDVVTLATLYTLRIIAGSAAIAVVTTFWLLAFSMFLFLGLALVKRYTELANLQTTDQMTIDGRAYSTTNLRALSLVGVCSSLMAVLVFAFYINAPDISRLYSTPLLLWLICPLGLYLVWRIWAFAHAGRLHDDPVLFTITDRQSQLITLLCGLLIWFAI